ncbi:hypothetical protein CEXT_536191 [Caerostris extrusa]|uniref:Uncharacterized protein n=1 Tax=Caerostris extrusa TaxID=172846 RepID=A0AAV4M8B2_CAEEX|nr:hypothetical protein CEXT_536191 [Caerostris extrusa]
MAKKVDACEEEEPNNKPGSWPTSAQTAQKKLSDQVYGEKQPSNPRESRGRFMVPPRVWQRFQLSGLSFTNPDLTMKERKLNQKVEPSEGKWGEGVFAPLRTIDLMGQKAPGWLSFVEFFENSNLKF